MSIPSEGRGISHPTKNFSYMDVELYSISLLLLGCIVFAVAVFPWFLILFLLSWIKHKGNPTQEKVGTIQSDETTADCKIKELLAIFPTKKGTKTEGAFCFPTQWESNFGSILLWWVSCFIYSINFLVYEGLGKIFFSKKSYAIQLNIES